MTAVSYTRILINTFVTLYGSKMIWSVYQSTVSTQQKTYQVSNAKIIRGKTIWKIVAVYSEKQLTDKSTLSGRYVEFFNVKPDWIYDSHFPLSVILPTVRNSALKDSSNCVCVSRFNAAFYPQHIYVFRMIRTMLQAGRPQVRFPMRSLDFSIHLIISTALWPWGRLSL
jgi:hypothetical protein